MSVVEMMDMSMDEISFGITSTAEIPQLEATRALREMLSVKDAHKHIIVPEKIISRCIEFLEIHHNPVLQYEASWVLTNVTASTSEQTMIVVNNGAIPKFVKLLKSPDVNLAAQAVWALGNIAGDGPEARNQVLEYNCMPPLLNLIYTNIPVSLTRNVVWVISNLCKRKNSPPSFEIVKEALPVLNSMLIREDSDILANTCCALCHLTQGEHHDIQVVVDSGVVPKLVTLLASSEFQVLTLALRAVGNIATGSDTQTDAIINAGGLENLKTLLEHGNPKIVKEATWTVSNIVAGTREQIQSVIDAGILPLVTKVISEGPPIAKKEAAWLAKNLFTGGSRAQLGALIQQDVLKPLCIALCVALLSDSSKDKDQGTEKDVSLNSLMNGLDIAEDTEEEEGTDQA